MRGGLCIRSQDEEGDAERGPHAAQKRPNSLELGSHSVLVFASYLSVVIFYGVTNHAPACLRNGYTFPSIPGQPHFTAIVLSDQDDDRFSCHFGRWVIRRYDIVQWTNDPMTNVAPAAKVNRKRHEWFTLFFLKTALVPCPRQTSAV